jgi:hypothetical protein
VCDHLHRLSVALVRRRRGRHERTPPRHDQFQDRSRPVSNVTTSSFPPQVGGKEVSPLFRRSQAGAWLESRGHHGCFSRRLCPYAQAEQHGLWRVGHR